MAFPDGWQRKCAIVIQAAQVAETLTDFPLLVTGDNLPAEIWANADDGGGDLRFSADDAGAVRLACEIVSFSTSGETAEIYVKVPSVSSAVNTTIYIWYNNTGQTQPAATDTYGSQAVWGSDYAAVYHFNQNPAGGTLLDSTANANNGTPAGGMDAADLVTGQIGAASAWDFDGVDDVVEIDDPFFGFAAFTIIVLAYQKNVNAGFVQNWDGKTALIRNNVQMFTVTGSQVGGTIASLSLNSWNQATYRYNNVNLNAWVNGVKSVTSYAQSGYLGTLQTPMAIGGRRSSVSEYYLNGMIDEIRLSTSAFADNKISSIYNNISNAATFAIAGTPETDAIELTINDLTIPVNLAAGAITQTHQINADDVTAPVTLDNITLTQIHQIVANALNIPVTLDNGTLTQTHILAINDMLIAVGLDNLTIVSGSVVNGIAKIQLTLTTPGVNMQLTTPAIKMTLDA